MASIRKIPLQPVLFTIVFWGAFLLPNASGIFGQVGSDPSEAPLRAERALRVFASGEESERMEIAENPRLYFEVLVQAEPDERSLPMLQILRGLVRREGNDWIATSFLANLGEYEKDNLLNGFYLDALWSGSPNRIWIAAQWFRDHEDERATPLLESSWPKEVRPWVLTDLVKALSRHGSSKYLDNFLDLATSEDSRLSSAAVGALKRLHDPEAIPVLIQLLTQGTSTQMQEASDALSAWPRSSEALQALLEATESDEPKVRGCALLALGRMMDSAALLRTLAVSLTDSSEEVRKMGIESVNASWWGRSAEKTLASLPEDLPEDRAILEKTLQGAFRPLMDISDRLRMLEELIVETGKRDRRCVYFRSQGGLVAENPEAFTIVPSPGLRSVRCHRYPGVPGDPHEFQRIPSSSLVFVRNHFEAPDGAWVDVDGFTTPQHCWVSATHIISTEVAGRMPEIQGDLYREFDIPDGETRSAVFHRLEHSGVLRVIEEGLSVIGVALRVVPADKVDVSLLRQAIASKEPILSREVISMLLESESGRELPSMQPLLREFFGPEPFPWAPGEGEAPMVEEQHD